MKRLLPRVKRFPLISTCFFFLVVALPPTVTQVINFHLGNGNGFVVVRVAPHFCLDNRNWSQHKVYLISWGKNKRKNYKMLSRKMQQPNALITHTLPTCDICRSRCHCRCRLMRHSMHLQPCACQHSSVYRENDICHPFSGL